ncbi:hypothetical protein ACFX13_007631 [Malus domestica]
MVMEYIVETMSQGDGSSPALGSRVVLSEASIASHQWHKSSSCLLHQSFLEICNLTIPELINHTDLPPDPSLTSAARCLNHRHIPETDHRAMILPYLHLCLDLHHHHPPPCISNTRPDPHHQQPATLDLIRTRIRLHHLATLAI